MEMKPGRPLKVENAQKSFYGWVVALIVLAFIPKITIDTPNQIWTMIFNFQAVFKWLFPLVILVLIIKNRGLKSNRRLFRWVILGYFVYFALPLLFFLTTAL